MYNDGIDNDFEHAHQKGLTRGFDLGWSYKGEFDRAIIIGHIDRLEKRHKKTSDHETRELLAAQISMLRQIYKEMKNHPNNRERIT